MLYGSQKRFDKNGDGKLKGAEWQRWYQYAYGNEIEAKEKRRRANVLPSRSVHKLQRTLRILSLTSLTGCIATLRIWRGSVRIRPSARCTLLCM